MGLTECALSKAADTVSKASVRLSKVCDTLSKPARTLSKTGVSLVGNSMAMSEAVHRYRAVSAARSSASAPVFSK